MVVVFLSEAQTHRKVSKLDYIQLSSMESVKYFLKIASLRTPKSRKPDLLARACQNWQTRSLEEDLTISTLKNGYISTSPVEMTSQGQDSATSSYSNHAPTTITANPAAAHRTENMTSTQEPSNDCGLDFSTKMVEDIRPHLLTTSRSNVQGIYACKAHFNRVRIVRGSHQSSSDESI